MNQPVTPARAEVAARDRVQHFVVESLAGRQQRRRRLVFKGGTLLRACWHHEYRYSEDLDFDWVTDPAESREELGLFVRDALQQASRAAQVDLSFRDQRGRMAVTWATPQGPAGVIGLDASRRTHPSYVPETRDWFVLQRYPGITARAPIVGYTLEAVLAAKLDCLAEPTRLAPRDFFDVDELLRSGEVDVAAAVQSFLALRYPDSRTRPRSDQLHEVLLGPGYQDYAALVSEWSTSISKALVPPDRLDFAAIFDSVDRLLEPALTAEPDRIADHIQ